MKTIRINKIQPSKELLLILIAIIIAFITFEVFLSALENQFVNIDDGTYICNNSALKEINIVMIEDWFEWIFTERIAANWHPLAIMSHLVDYNIWGLDPFGHHLTSILFHAFNAFLVFILSVNLINIYFRDSKANFSILLAGIITTLLFSLHPLRVESVVWISERKDVLYSFFFLLSLLVYIKYASSRSSDKWLYFATSFICFCFSIMSKPMAITLPFVLMILDYFPLKRFVVNKENKTLILKILFWEKVPFLIVSLLSVMMTLWAQEPDFTRANAFVVRIIIAGWDYVFYLYKFINPSTLLPLYPLPENINILSFEYAGFFAIFILINFIIFKYDNANSNHKKMLSAIWLYYVITLLPVVGLIQVGKQIAADRYTYLPSLGPSLLVGIGAAVLIRHIRWKYVKITTLSLLVFLALLMVNKTKKQISIWHDSISLWTHQIENQDSPPFRGYIQRSTAFISSDFHINNYKLAIQDVDNAVAAKPHDKEAHYTRGLIYQSMNESQKAIDNFEKAIEIERSRDYELYDVKSYLQLGIIYYELNRFVEAMRDLDRALEIEPRYWTAYYYRGLINYKSGFYDEAVKNLNMAILYDPNYAEAYFQLSRVFRAMGDNKQSLYYLKETAKRDKWVIKNYLAKEGHYDAIKRMPGF